jgi:hypothetical protein
MFITRTYIEYGPQGTHSLLCLGNLSSILFIQWYFEGRRVSQVARLASRRVYYYYLILLFASPFTTPLNQPGPSTPFSMTVFSLTFRSVGCHCSVSSAIRQSYGMGCGSGQ